MDCRKDFYIASFVTGFFVFNLTRTTYTLFNKIDILENKIESITERLRDLELFKIKVYNNEAVPGRRAWDDFELDIDIDEEDEID